ncbi:MAG TPA: hypothetical protein VE684_15270 [Crenalkalicoccus sp.]|nr:hypothetical protein [Crenalkalicoccus sp.]
MRIPNTRVSGLRRYPSQPVAKPVVHGVAVDARVPNGDHVEAGHRDRRREDTEPGGDRGPAQQALGQHRDGIVNSAHAGTNIRNFRLPESVAGGSLMRGAGIEGPRVFTARRAPSSS